MNNYSQTAKIKRYKQKNNTDMKKETIFKKIKNNLCTTKGEVKEMYKDALCNLAKYPRSRHQLKCWYSRGRSLKDYTNRYLDVCTALGLDYIWSNDAPRRGQEGWYITLTAKGARQIKEYSEYLRAQKTIYKYFD